MGLRCLAQQHQLQDHFLFSEPSAHGGKVIVVIHADEQLQSHTGAQRSRKNNPSCPFKTDRSGKMHI